MPLGQKLLLMFSPSQLLSIFILVFISVAIVGMIMSRMIIPKARLKAHNDVTGPIFGVIGTIYAVMLAFVVVISWESHDTTKQHMDSEVSGLVSLFAEAVVFKDPMKSHVRGLIFDYADDVINNEWKELKVGKTSPVTATKLYDMIKAYGSYEPTSKPEEICLTKSIERVSNLIELRRRRQLDAKDGIHPILWSALISVGLITVFMSCLFGTENLHIQVMITISLAVIIAIIMFTIVELDFPFTGKMGLSSSAFQEMIVKLKTHVS